MSEDGLVQPEYCESCGEKIETAVGIDNYTQVTHYTITEYSKEYYCDKECLVESILATTDHSGGDE